MVRLVSMWQHVRMSISRPTRRRDRHDTQLDCQMALEARIQAAMDEAFEAGWSHVDVTTAVMELANAWALGLVANAQTEADIKRANGELPN